MIVIYFLITIPIAVILFVLVRTEFYSPNYYNGYTREWGNTILWSILIPLIYLIMTDILRGAVYYIVR